MSSRDSNEIFGGMRGMPSRNVMSEDFGYEVPVEAVPLPSRGLVYAEDSAMSGQETIDIRAMTAKDEDILTSRALIKKGTVITHLLQGCIINKAIDVEDMLIGDRNAIMTALRVTGYGPDYEVKVECPACGEQSKQVFDLSQLPIKRLGTPPVAEGINLFEVQLPVTKKRVRLKFLTGKDEREITITEERKKKQGSKADNLVTQRLKYAITSIEGIEDKTKIGMFISNMPARDSLFLRRWLDDNEPGIDMKAWMECSHCDEHSEVSLPMGASFFWPDA